MDNRDNRNNNEIENSHPKKVGNKNSDFLPKITKDLTNILQFDIPTGIDTLTDEQKLKLIKIITHPNSHILIEAGITSPDDLLKLNDIISKGNPINLNQLIEAGITSPDDLLKLKVIICKGSQRNLNLLIEAGITSYDDLLKLNDIICNGHFYNLNTLIKEGITSPDDLLKLKVIIYNRYFYNLDTLIKEGITSTDDLIKLKDIIIDGKNKNLEILIKAGITSPDDLLKLKDIICSNLFSDNLEILIESGFTSLSDILKLKDIIIDGKSSNLEILIKKWIISTDDLLKLKDIISKGNPCNLNLLNEIGIISPDEIGIISPDEIGIISPDEIGIISPDDLLKFKDIICDGKPSNLEILIKKGITSSDDLLKLKVIINNGDSKNLEILIKGGITSSDDLLKLKVIISDGNSKNLEILIKKGITSSDDLLKFKDIICDGDNENLEILIKKGITSPDDLLKLKDIICNGDSDNLEILIESGFTSLGDLLKFKDIICDRKSTSKLGILIKKGITSPDDLLKLKDIICDGNSENLELLIEEGITSPDDLLKLKDIICNGDSDNLEILIESGFTSLCDLLKLTNIINKGDFYNLNQLIKPGITSPDDLLKLKNIIAYGNSENLELLIEEGITSPDDLLKLEDIIINNSINENEKELIIERIKGNNKLTEYPKLVSQGFIINNLENDYKKIISDTLEHLYGLSIELTDKDAEIIMNFVNNIGGINKGYTILILTIEKMIEDEIKEENFINILIKKIEKYTKLLEIYPEDRIPKGLKISTGLEIEITKPFEDWYNGITKKTYKETAREIVKKANIGTGLDGVIEFSTKPATNPMVTILEIYLLQELNLLDINDMQKLQRESKETKSIIDNVEYNNKSGTGYHLNIGTDIGVKKDENIDFIQNLCTILPRSGICNGKNVNKINHIKNKRYKNSKYLTFHYSDDEYKYVELRTYSVDNIESFEKNIIFNTYALMGSQAQKQIFPHIDHEDIIKLKDNKKINNAKELIDYLDATDISKTHQDLKSKKIAAEFIFMQISILRTIDNYNKNFINNEILGTELIKDLPKAWQEFLCELLFSEQKETIGHEDKGWSTIITKRYAPNLKKSINFNEYHKKKEPFSYKETEALLKKFGDNVDKKWIPYIKKWLNKNLLWTWLSDGYNDTQKIEDEINNKISNIDRIKNYINKEGGKDNSKINKKWLEEYFNENLSLDNFNIYDEINTDFMNRIINLNNFFLKDDNANANGVLETTVLNGKINEEPNISKYSVFQTGIIRKGYNYYQGGSENMLLHSAQTCALNYMENVKNILNEKNSENIIINTAA